MKRLKQLLPVLATLLVIGAGAGMPWAAAWVQDLYGVSSQDAMPFDPVILTLQQDSEIGDVLRLMSAPYEEADWPGETHMTVDEASDTALEVLALLDQNGLLEAGDLGVYGYIDPGIMEQMKASGGNNATPALFISLDGSTAIIWVCHWKLPTGPSYELWIDDATGKAVIGYIPSPPPEDQEVIYQRMERWLSFFHNYYGMEIQEVQDLGGDVFSQLLFLIDPGDGKDTLGMLVNTFYYEMSFVPCSPDVVDNPPPQGDERYYTTLPVPPDMAVTG